MVSFLNKEYTKELKICSVRVFWPVLASLSNLGLSVDHLMVSKFHNGIHDPKGQENQIYTIVKGIILLIKYEINQFSCSGV